MTIAPMDQKLVGSVVGLGLATSSAATVMAVSV